MASRCRHPLARPEKGESTRHLTAGLRAGRETRVYQEEPTATNASQGRHMAQDRRSGKQTRLILERFESAQDRLVLQQSDLSLETLATMIDSGAIDIRPHYQRRDRWSTEKQSHLIESFLLNIPVPPLYLAEDDFGTYSVIDGKQRLTAIRAFMRNELELGELGTFASLEGSRFEDLPRELGNALQIRPYLRVVTLLKQSDPDLKYEVFQRLNTGGETLNAQEIRNVAYHGPLNDLIYEKLVDNQFLQQQLKIRAPREKSPAYRKMLDAEYVLRYLTLAASWETFSGDLAKSMDEFMDENQHADGPRLRRFDLSFRRAIGWCEKLWGDHAFNRPDGAGWRDQTLAGMYDAEMVAVSQFSNDQLDSLDSAEVLEMTRALFEDQSFDTAVRVGTNSPRRVRYRIERLYESLTTLLS